MSSWVYVYVSLLIWPCKFNLDRLNDPETKRMYTVETNNRFDILLDKWDGNGVLPEEIWTAMKSVYLESAEKVLGKKVNKAPKPFVSEEVLQLIEEKRKVRKQNMKTEYKKAEKRN